MSHEAIINRRMHALAITTPLLRGVLNRRAALAGSQRNPDAGEADALAQGIREVASAAQAIAELIANGTDQPNDLRFYAASRLATLLSSQYAVTGEYDLNKLMRDFELPKALDAVERTIVGNDVGYETNDPRLQVRVAALGAMAPIVVEISKFAFFASPEDLTREIAVHVQESARTMAVRLLPDAASAGSGMPLYAECLGHCGGIFADIYRAARVATADELLRRREEDPADYKLKVAQARSMGGLRHKLAAIYSEYDRSVGMLTVSGIVAVDSTITLDPQEARLQAQG